MQREFQSVMLMSFGSFSFLFILLAYIWWPFRSTTRIQEDVPIQGDPPWKVMETRTEYSSVPWRNSKLVPRVLTKSEHRELVLLLSKVASLFAEYRIEWVMFYGTLLGSYMCHDVLPWDDDLDVLVEVSDLVKLATMEEHGVLRHHGLKHVVHNTIHKIFFVNKPYVGPFPWTWPAVDLIPYVDHGDTVENLDYRVKLHKFSVPRDKFLPFHMRPLATMWLPAPRDPYYMLNKTYHYKGVDHLRCLTAEYDHKMEVYRMDRPRAPCQDLKKEYPFVWRNKLDNNDTHIIETLKLDNYTLYNVSIAEPFYKSANPFNWKLL